jgi:serine/threonine-protein kinase
MKFCPQCQRQYSDLENVCPVDDTILYLKDLLNLVGCTIANQYIVEQLAGIGGMSAVYRAYHKRLECPVALKILLPHLTLNDPEMVRMFEREARAAGQINHPNIARLYESGRTSEDLIYLVMEWLEGHTLEKILRQNAPLDWEATALILQQITAGLDAAHHNRIIHRDLKPGNIMVVPQEQGPMQVKILDFGIAKIATTDSDNFVSTAVGTVHYASPEQMIPGNQIDPRTDLYSVGVMLYEMLTGHLPFEGGSVAEMVRQHLLETPLPLSFNRPDAPPAVITLVEQLLAKKIAARPATATEVWQRFEQALREARLLRADHTTRPTITAAAFTECAPTIREGFSFMREAPLPESHAIVLASHPQEVVLPAVSVTPFEEEEYDVRELLSSAPDQDDHGAYEMNALVVPPTSASTRNRKWMLALAVLLVFFVLWMGWKKNRALAWKPTPRPFQQRRIDLSAHRGRVNQTEQDGFRCYLAVDVKA